MNLNLCCNLFSSRLIVTFAALVGAQLATAQVNEWLAQTCPVLQQPAQKSLIELCNSHKACAMMVKAQYSCPKIQNFLTTLDRTMGAAPSGLMGFLTRRSITPEAVWQASLPDALRDLEQLPEWKAKTDLIAKSLLPGSTEQFSGKNTAGREFVLYGHEKDDGSTANRNGASIIFVTTPVMQRSTYTSGQRKQFDHVNLNGQRIVAIVGADGSTLEGLERTIDGMVYAGTFIPNVDNWGNGILKLPTGERLEGFFANKSLQTGKRFRADGTLEAEGTFNNNELSVGKRFDATGVTIAEDVDKPKVQALAAAAAREAADRQRREQEDARAAEEQRKIAQGARLEREFQSSLTTMNAGQLFNKADELRAAGDTVRARQAQRALIERFPNHPLAATAAQQMAGTGSARSAAAQTPNQSVVTQPASGGSASSNAGRCSPDSTLIPAYVQAQHEWVRYANNSILRPTTAEEAIARFNQSYDYYGGISTERLRESLAESKRYYGNWGSSQLNPLQAHSLAESRITNGMIECEIQRRGSSSSAVASAPSGVTGCASTPQESFRRFDKEMSDFAQSKPSPSPTSSSGSGARAQNQYALFYATEGLIRLEKYRNCLSAADYAANKAALEGARDNGKTGCEKLSTNPASCTATYPRN